MVVAVWDDFMIWLASSIVRILWQKAMVICGSAAGFGLAVAVGALVVAGVPVSPELVLGPAQAASAKRPISRNAADI